MSEAGLIDFSSIICGFFSLSMGAICLRLSADSGRRFPWLWLGGFGLLHGLGDWAGLTAKGLPGSIVFDLVSRSFPIISGVVLLEFGRRCGKHRTGTIAGILGSILLLFWLCGPAGQGWIPGTEAACRTALGLAAAVLSACALWRAAAGGNPGRASLRIASVSMAIWGLAQIPPGWTAGGPGRLPESALAISGALCALAAFACAGGLWLHGQALRAPQDRDRPIGVLIAPALLFLFGSLGILRREGAADLDLRGEILDQAARIARTIDPQMVKGLSFTAGDKERPEFGLLRKQMVAYGRFAGLRSVYSTAIRDGEIVFGPESLQEADPLASPPGTVYEKPSEELRDLFRTARPLAVGPYTDENGTFISAFTPVIDPRSGQVLMAVGIDVPAGNWEAALAEARLKAIHLTMLPAAVLILGLGLLQWRGRPDAWWLRHAPALQTAGLGAALTVVLMLALQEVERRKGEQGFRQLSEARAEIIRRSFGEILEGLSSLGRFFEGSEEITLREFEEFAGPMARVSKVQAWEWISRVPARERERFEDYLRRQGLGSFRVFGGSPAGEGGAGREDIYPVTYVTPLEGNEAAVGFDLSSEPIRRAALEEAARMRLPIATSPITLIQESERQKGILFFQPVYRGSKRKPQGFALGVVRLQSAFGWSLMAGARSEREIEVHLLDVSSPGEPETLASNIDPEGPSASACGADRSGKIFPLFLPGRTWAIDFHPGQALPNLHGNWMAWPAALAGLSLTAALTALAWFLTRRRAILEAQVLRRTAELRESQEQLHLIAKATGVGLWDWNVQTGAVVLNERWAGILGYKLEELGPSSIQTWKDLCHPDDLKLSDERIQKHFSGETEMYDLECRMKHKDGRWVWIHDRGSVVERTPDGRPLRMIGTHLDITERKSAEAALRESEEKFQKFFDGNPSLMAVSVLPEKRLVEVNTAFLANLGYRQEEVLGKTSIELCLFVDPRALVEMQHQVVETGRIKNRELQVRAKDGRILDGLFSGEVIADRGKRLLLSVMTDVTERKAMERELQVAKEAAEAASRAKSDFLANMSHEIRTPMNGVIGMTGLLLDTGLSPEQRQFAEIIRASGEDLLSLINDILDFSKIEARKLDLEILEFDLAALLEDFASSIALKAQEKGLELTCSMDRDVPASIRGDPGRLRQVLLNLAGNAIKFTSAGEVSIRASLVAATAGGIVVRFAVRDTGIGIPEEKRGLLFREFSQVEASTARKFGGTGLGLAISKRLAELMGGEIGVKSAPGQGSEFWFTARFARGAGTVRQATPAAVLRDVRVLVVDDNDTNRELLIGHLRALGVRAEGAQDGPTALVKLGSPGESADPFRVAILDASLPVIDGRAVARAIEADRRLEGTTTVLMTALGNQGTGPTGSVRIDASWTKPIRWSAIAESLAAVLSKKPFRSPEPAVNTPRSLPDLGGRNPRILLVEDNITNQKVAAAMLRKFGLRIDAVANGIEAIRTLESLPYDLVLMDVQMPEMDGLEATRRIRAPDSTVRDRRIPIIAMTAHAMQGDRERCLAAGMDDYVVKPVMPGPLKETLIRWLGRGSSPHQEDASDRDAGGIAAAEAEGGGRSSGKGIA
jgi:PAS domain S-box-containing protein